MVGSEHRLLSGVVKIWHLCAVMGISIGGMPQIGTGFYGKCVCGCGVRASTQGTTRSGDWDLQQ
jgi:hypothetical protein